MSYAAVVIRAPLLATQWSGRWGWTLRWSAHQHAAGARHDPPPHLAAEVSSTTEADTGAGPNDKKSSASEDREVLGRSRGGVSTREIGLVSARFVNNDALLVTVIGDTHLHHLTYGDRSTRASSQRCSLTKTAASSERSCPNRSPNCSPTISRPRPGAPKTPQAHQILFRQPQGGHRPPRPGTPSSPRAAPVAAQDWS